MPDLESYEELIAFLKSKSGLQMAHIYKPAMLLVVLRSGGSATKEQVAREFVLRDSSQIDFYRREIVHKMPGRRLVRDGLLSKDKDIYSLTSVMAGLSHKQRAEVEAILEARISSYMDMRNPFGDNNLDAVRGSVRFEVLKRSGGRCELCGVSSQERQIDVDHIVPRAKGGSNESSNLQALCRTCNSQKRDRDDTNFTAVHQNYKNRERHCVFCSPEGRVLQENKLAYLMADGYPVTEGHSLIIPKRHIADYFDLYRAERNALDSLARSRKIELEKIDPSIAGFNIGINAGECAGQSIFHVHVHLIPRRPGDVKTPRGGIRNVIPGKGNY